MAERKPGDKLNIIISVVVTIVFLVMIVLFVLSGRKNRNSAESSSYDPSEENYEMTGDSETTGDETCSETTDGDGEKTSDNETSRESDAEESTTEETTTEEPTTEEPTTEEPTTEEPTIGEEENDSPFAHPGVLHTEESFEYMKYAVENRISPNYETYNVLLSSGLSAANWYPRAVETVIRGGNGDNVSKLYIDVARAYQCAIIWRISGSKEHGEAACRILNAWSATLKTVTGNADRYLASGLFGYQLANISEIMRDHPMFELEQMQTMLLEVFYYPLNERFLIGNHYGYDHNDAYISNYWANWDLCNLASTLAIGIFCDNEEIYNKGIKYFVNGMGNGSLYNAIPFVFDDGTAQWQESGRDQGHTNLGLGLMACVCEMAWNQGDDLYSMSDNRLMKAAEYIAKYNNGEDVQFSEYEWGSGRNGDVQHHYVVSAAGRGEVRPIWSMIYNHYAGRMGYEIPNVTKRLESFGYEYGAGGHATTYDQPGWGTLTFAGNLGNTVAEIPAPNFEEGIYTIKSVHTGKVLTVADVADGVGDVAQRTPGTSDSEQWELIYTGDGEYIIKNVKTGLYLQVADDSHANGALIQAGEYTGSTGQRFAILIASSKFRIINSGSGKAIDVRDWSGDDNADMIQWRYCLGNNQRWIFEKCE